jgi:hypothetical protein
VGNRQQWLVNGATVNTYIYDADDAAFRLKKSCS